MPYTYDRVTNLFQFMKRENVLAINSDAITPNNLSLNATFDYMRKPYAERIADSPYRDAINAEIAAHPGCTLTEFSEIPLF